MTSEHSEDHRHPALIESLYDIIPDDLDSMYAYNIDPLWQGVPEREQFEIRVQADDLLDSIKPGSDIRDTLAQLKQLYSAGSEKYPDAEVWDILRSTAATHIYTLGGQEWNAVDLIMDIQSDRELVTGVNTLVRLALDVRAERDLVGVFIGRMRQISPERRDMILRDFVETRIIAEPMNPVIDLVIDVIHEDDPEYDLFETWISTRQQLDPTDDWQEAEAYLKRDDLWQDVPIRARLSAHTFHRFWRIYLTQELSTEAVQQAVDDLEEYATRYPAAAVWDHMRESHCLDRIQDGQPMFAFDFARALRDPMRQQTVVREMIQAGFPEDALELASIIRDPDVMADTLLNGGWTDGSGQRRLDEITAQYGELS